VPRRSAERRGRPQADDRGNADRPWRSPHWPAVRMRSSEVPVRNLSMRLSALRLPLFYLEAKLSCRGLPKTRAQKARRENEIARFTSPRVRGERRRPWDAVLSTKNADAKRRLCGARVRGRCSESERCG